MTTENLSFYNPHSKGIGEITCTSQETAHTSREVLALIRFGPAGDMYLYEPETARELLAAAFAAVQILDPEGADDTLSDLLDAGALNKILRRIAQQEARGSDVQPDPYIDAMAAEHVQEYEPDAAKAACRWCATTEGILLRFGTRDDGSPRWFCGDVKACYERRPVDAAPDTAQPEDIPAQACSRCAAANTPLVLAEDGTLRCHNSGACGRRVQATAKAGAVHA